VLQAIANNHTRRLATDGSNRAADRHARRKTSCTTSRADPSSLSWRNANRYSSAPCAS
jgi:hypothetical protein